MGMKLGPTDRLVAAGVTKETKDIVKALADSAGISVSEWIRVAIEQRIERIKTNDNWTGMGEACPSRMH